MTREEEIIKASHLYTTRQQKPFVDGAKWADKTMLDKACEWLNNFYSEDRHCFLVAEDIEAFKKAMEE